MKPQCFITVLVLLFATSNLFGQTNFPAKKIIVSYDAASQSNVDVIVSGNMNDAVPCPPEYANIISNTNLFTPDEQKLLEEAQLYLTNNSGSGSIIHHVRNKDGDGYDLYDEGKRYGSAFGGSGLQSEYQFIQIKHGVKEGLDVLMSNEHCEKWLYYSNGWAVDKWLEWGNVYSGSKLILWAKFKEPFDVDRTHNQNPKADAEEARAYEILGKRDDCYDAARVFYKQAGRWPTNIVELSDFARSTHEPRLDVFDASFYKNAKFRIKEDGGLEITYLSRDIFLGRDLTVVNVDMPAR